MIIKENEITKLIEDKMGFKFEDLELVGKFNKYVSSCFKIAFIASSDLSTCFFNFMVNFMVKVW